MPDVLNDIAPDPAPATRRKPAGKRQRRSYASDYAALQGRVETAVRLLDEATAGGKEDFGVSMALARVALKTLKGGE